MTMRNEYIGAPPKKSYFWRWFFVVGGTAAGLGVLYLANLGTFFSILGFLGLAPEIPRPAPVVSTITVETQAWQPTVSAVGTFSANEGADLTAEVSGIVDQVLFNSGGEIEAGVPLVRLRATDETAKLRTLEANAELAAATDARNRRLFDIQGISQAELEASDAALKAAQAAVAEQRAIIEKKVVRAPFAGILGIRQVNVGQYVNPGSPIVTLQSLDPIHFDFYVPQQTLERLSVGQNVTIHVDGYPDTDFTGEIATIDPKIDPATRNVAIRAVVPNESHQLLPGMYATADVTVGGEENYLTVPQTAVTFNPYGTTVYRVDEVTEDGMTHFVATQTFVTTGDTRGDQVAILSGINAGDEIVSAGQFKLQNGVTIEINNEVQPSNDPNPRPLQR